MSASEAERFANDLKGRPDFLADLKKSAAGLGLSGVVEFGKQHGYGIDVDDAKSYIEDKVHRELTDEQLDRIAGGKGGGGGTVTNVSTAINVTQAVSVQTAGAVTSVAAGAEVAVFAVGVIIAT